MSDLSKYNLPSGYHNEAVAICEEFFGNESKFEEWHVRRIESALHKWMCDGARVVESKLTRPNDAKWMIAEGLKLLKPSDYVEVLTYLASPMGIRLTDAEEIIKALGRVCELNSNPPKQSSEGE